MDVILVTVMAIGMAGAAILCWRMENLPNADKKSKKTEDGGKKS